MASWLVVWFTVGIVSTVAILACLIGLMRHVLVLGRTVQRFRDEAQPIADDLARERTHASEHVAALGARRRGDPSTGSRR
jgi:hypothetical protein